MPKICCFFEKLEEIKKKLNKIKKLMGETFQNLRTHGKSVVVERQKNIVIERSEDSIITRKQTIIREKILNDENTLSPDKKPNKHISHTAKTNPNTSARVPPGKEDQIVNSKRTTTTTTTTASPLDSSFLPNPTKAFSALELAALKKDIDDEITNLKLQRNTLLKQAISTARENAKMREKKPVNTQIQNDMTWDQNFSTPRAETIEVQFEKFSSEHNVHSTVCHKRDEQTSCRPRMRTIGLQKNTQRSAVSKPDNIPVHNSLLNLKYNSTCEAIPTAFACFDYGPNCTVNDYYRNPSHSHSGCQNYCQRYNLTGDYNGVVCNQNTYRQMGRTPCAEYNYCRDEYYYDYSNMSSQQQHNQAQETTLPPRLCYCHGDCRTHNHRRKKRSHLYEHKRGKGNRIDEYEQQLLTKKYLLQQITKQQRDLEREEARALALKAARLKLDHLETERNAHRDKKEHKIEKWQEESAARIASLITRGKLSSKKTAPIDSDSDTEEQKYQLKKEKLKVTKKKSYSIRKASSRGDHGYYEDISSDGTRQEEYNVETKRTLEKMRIHAYKPLPKHDSARLSKMSEEKGKSVKKEKRYAEYITQYKQDPLTTNLEAHKNVQTSITLTQQGHNSNRLESVADEVGLIPKTTDLKSTQTSSINTRPIPKMYSNKRISAHDGNELWDSPNTAPQFAAQKRLTKEDFAQTDKHTSKPAEYKRLSSVGTNSPQLMRSNIFPNEQNFGIKEDKATSPFGGSFLSRDDAYQRGTKKSMIPTDLSPLERLAREESLSQGSRGQTIQEQLSMRDHLFRGEYFPQQDTHTSPDKSIDEKLSVRDRIIKVESFDAGTRETTIEKEYSFRSLRDKFSADVIQEQTFVERVSTSDRIILEDSPQYRAENFLKGSLQDNISTRESLKASIIAETTPRGSLARGENTPRENSESINQGQFLTPVNRNKSSLEEGSPRQRMTREGSIFTHIRKGGTLEERSPRAPLTREGSYSAESKKPSNQEERTPREGSYNAESRKRSTQEESTPREYLTKETDYIPNTPKQSLTPQSAQEERSPRKGSPREGSYVADSRKLSTLAERSPRERLTREGSYVGDNRKLSTLEERSSQERLPREKSYPAAIKISNNEEEHTPREYLTRDDRFSADVRKQSTQEDRIPREYLTEEGSYTTKSRKPPERVSRDESYIGESRKQSNQERTPRESLTREGSYTVERRKLGTQEERILRELLTREESYRTESPKLNTVEERTPREFLRREESYTPESRKLSTQEERIPHEYFTREGSYTAESRKISNQEERSPSEYLAKGESYIPQTRKLSNQEELRPAEHFSREGSYTAESRKLSTQKEHTPRGSLEREGSYAAENRKLSTQEERTAREYLNREGSYIPQSRKLSNQDDRMPPVHLSREGSYAAESRKQTQGERIPREYLTEEESYTTESRKPPEHFLREESFTAESRKQSTQERTPRESLKKEGSYVTESRKRSTLEQNSPRESLTREGSYVGDNRKLSTLEERSSKERLPREGSYSAEIQMFNTPEERIPREYLTREGSYTADSRKLSNQKERTPREYLAKGESYIPDSRRVSNQEELRPAEHFSREGSHTAESRKLSTQEERSPRQPLRREESFQQGSQKRTNLEERSPQVSLTREKSYIKDNHEVGSLQEHFPREESYIQEIRKRNTQQEHSPRERLSREASFLQGSPVIEDNVSTRENLPREDTMLQGSRRPSTQKDRSPQESLKREESYSPRRSAQEGRTTGERLSRESNFLQDSRAMHEHLSPRERLTGEDSIIQQSRKGKPQERTPRESLAREESYNRDGSNQSTLEERSAQNNLILEEHRKENIQEEHTPPERLSREASFLQNSRVMQDKLSPRERLSRDPSSRKESTLEEHTPRLSLSREASFMQGSRVIQGNLSPRKPLTRENSLQQSSEEEQQAQRDQSEYDKIIPTARSTRQESVPQEFLEQTLETRLSPRENLMKERNPRKSLTKEASNIQDNQKRSPTRTPRESFTRQESNLQDNQKRSTPQQSTPRESLKREGSFLQEKRRQSSQEKHTPRESLTKEETNLQDRRKRSTQDQQSPRVTKEESFVKGRREKNTLDHKPLRKRFKESVHEKVIPQTRLTKMQANQQGAQEQTLKTHTSLRDQAAREEIGKRSRQDPRSPRKSSTKKDSFLQGGQESDIKKNGTSHEDKDEETFQEQEQLPTIQITPPEEESNLEDSGKQRTTLARSPRESLNQSSPQRRRSMREESSIIASQLSSLSPRRSTREESFARSNRVIRDSLTSRKRLSNTPTNARANARRSTYLIPDVHRRSTLHLPDTQSLRRSNFHIPDIGRQSALQLLPEITRQSTLRVSESRGRSTVANQPPRWTKEEILYPYLTYSQEPREPYAFRKSNIPQDNKVEYYEYERPPQNPTPPINPTPPHIPDKIPDPPTKEKPNDENREKKDEPRKSLQDDCEVPPVICPEICDDTPYECVPCIIEPYECVPCIVEPETPCRTDYNTCQNLNAQNENCYNLRPCIVKPKSPRRSDFNACQNFNVQNENYYDPRQAPINARTYHEREMIYTKREYDPCARRCYGPIAESRVQDNTYDERPTTTTTASSQASCSDYRPYTPPRQMLICVNPLEQQLQREQQPLQVQTIPPTTEPQFLPSQQFETEDELLQRLDLESRLCCCDAIQQENMYYYDGDEIKHVNFEPPIDQNYTEDEECRCDREMFNNVDYSNGSYEQTMEDYMERKTSNCTVTSAYATASSGISCNCLCNNEELDPPEHQPQQSNHPSHQNRVIPEYTGCPCMLATYLDMMGLTGDSETPKEKSECVKRISFR